MPRHPLSLPKASLCVYGVSSPSCGETSPLPSRERTGGIRFYFFLSVSWFLDSFFFPFLTTDYPGEVLFVLQMLKHPLLLFRQELRTHMHVCVCMSQHILSYVALCHCGPVPLLIRIPDMTITPLPVGRRVRLYTRTRRRLSIAIRSPPFDVCEGYEDHMERSWRSTQFI